MSPLRDEMLLEEGLVLGVQRDAGGSSVARVRLLAGEHCEGCPANAVCRPGGDEARVLEVRDPLRARPGDRVRVRVLGSAVLRASILVYGLPLLLVLAGVGLGAKLWSPGTARGDLLGFALGVGLAAAAAPAVAWWARRTDRGRALDPEIVEITRRAVESS